MARLSLLLLVAAVLLAMVLPAAAAGIKQGRWVHADDAEVAPAAGSAPIPSVAAAPVQATARLSAEPYNTSLATQMLHMAGASYCSGQSVEAWSCSFCQESDVKNFQPQGVAYNASTDMLAFVGYEPDTDSVMISFRGTSLLSIKDWLEDLNFFAIPAICPGCEVHEGFYAAYMSIRDDFMEYVHDVKQRYPNSDVVLTGHSLGGALAYVAAVDLAINEGIKVTHSYTFGQPRVGNSVFKDTWSQLFQEDATFYRVTHSLDPVPHVPARIQGFTHPPTEVYYDGLNTQYKLCDIGGEDASCADQWILPVGLTDHVTYLGLDFIAQFLKCNL